METKTRPVHEVRLGSIKAAVWRNNTETGTRFNTTFSRIYKNGEQWSSSDSFGRDDLLLLRKVADAAHTWIMQNQDQQNAEPAPAEAGYR